MQDEAARRATFEWIGKRLRWAREQIPLTQTEFARSLGITTVTLSHAEAGKRALSVLSLITAANRLRCGTEYLLTGDLVAVEPELRERLVLAHPELLRPAGRAPIPYLDPADEAAAVEREAQEAAEKERLRDALNVLTEAVFQPRPRRRRRANAEAAPVSPQSSGGTGTAGP